MFVPDPVGMKLVQSIAQPRGKHHRIVQFRPGRRGQTPAALERNRAGPFSCGTAHEPGSGHKRGLRRSHASGCARARVGPSDI
jgi:hypothetical protein